MTSATETPIRSLKNIPGSRRKGKKGRRRIYGSKVSELMVEGRPEHTIPVDLWELPRNWEPHEMRFFYVPEFSDPELHAEILKEWPVPAIVGNYGMVTESAAAQSSYPLLTPEQEYHLFRKMHFHRYLAHQARQCLSHSDEVRLRGQITRHLRAAIRVRNDIVMGNQRLVLSIASRLSAHGLPIEELLSVGNLPLIRAVEIFDYRRGLKFSTYATWAVRHALYRYLKKHRRKTSPVPLEEIAQTLAHEGTDSVPGMAERKELVARLHRQLALLGTREQTILHQRFGLKGGSTEKKLHQIAADLGLSTERVRQILLRTLAAIKSILESSEK